jgi:hypothetical protein
MKLKTIYETAEEIPEGYADLYSERNGHWELTAIEGVKTQADIDRVQSALVKERTDHKATKELLKPFEGLDPEVVVAQAHELEEVKAQLDAIKNDGTIDETKLEPIIAARVAQRVAPVEREKTSLARQLEAAKTALTAKDGEVGQLKTTITTGNVERAIRDAAIEAKVQTPAVVDAVMHGSRVFEVAEDGRIITRDVAGVTPGLSPSQWLNDMKEKAPHWWPASVGGGSQGSGGGPKGGYAGANNPWSKAGWSITKQGALVRQLGEAKASEIAGQAGCKIGDTKPAQDAA